MDFRPIDADHHYYESLDAFTRYMDPKLASRGPRLVRDLDGRRVHLLVGQQVCRFVPNPTFDPIIVPGCLDQFFRGQIPDDFDRRDLYQIEPLRTEYQDRDQRVGVIEQQGLDAVLMFPTLACGIEQALRDDIPATMATLSAFNRWLEDDWGFAYQDRILSVPMLSLADPETALVELERLIERGARAVHLRPAPVPAANGTTRSLGDPLHDPVWARLADAGVPAAFHLGDSGYESFAARWGAKGTFEGYGKKDLLSRLVVSDRPIHDTVGSLLLHGVFQRHPKLKIMSIENGSDWLHLLVKRLRKLRNQEPSDFVEDPGETLHRHLWLTPYCEEDFGALADLIGTERILFGSDWPHGEGLAQPVAFEKELAGFDDQAKRRIMRDNCRELLGMAA